MIDSAEDAAVTTIELRTSKQRTSESVATGSDQDGRITSLTNDAIISYFLRSRRAPSETYTPQIFAGYPTTAISTYVTTIKDQESFSHEVYLQAEWVGLAENEKEELSVGDVTKIMSEINDRLKKSQLSLLDSELSGLMANKMSPDAISAVARITASARDKLANWGYFIASAEKVIAAKYPQSQALRGIPSAASGNDLRNRSNNSTRDTGHRRWAASLWDTLR